MGVFNWIKTMFDSKPANIGNTDADRSRSGRCVDEDTWLKAVSELRNNQNMTVRLWNKNGKSFTVPEFIDGDKDKIIVCVNGLQEDLLRKWWLKLEVVPKVVREGVVITWKKDRHPDFGFIHSEGLDFYFNQYTIKDYRLVQSLARDNTGQRVRFRVVRRIAGRQPLVEVLECLSPGKKEERIVEGSPFYSRGWSAKNRGDVGVAIECFRQVIQNKNDVYYHASVKELAECINRQGDPEGAFRLIEEHRKNFSEEEQISLDRMELLYLQKAKKYNDALEMLNKILLADELPPNQRRHFEQLREVVSKRLHSQSQCMEEEVVESPDEDAKEKYNLATLLGELAEYGLTHQTMSGVGEYINKILGGDDNRDDDTTNVIKICHEAEVFAGTIDYEDRKAAVNSMNAIIEAYLGADSQTELTHPSLITLLTAVRDAAKSTLAGMKPSFQLSHQESASYSINDFGMVDLQLVLTSGDASMTVSDITASDKDNQDSRVDICKQLIGGGKHKFILPLKPSRDGLKDSRQNVKIVIEYTLGRSDGEDHGAWEAELPVVFDDKDFQPFELDYKKYAGGGIPEGKYFVGRQKILNEMVTMFCASNGGKCYLVHGQRRTGKNTLRDNLFKRLKTEVPNKYACTTMSMRGVSSDDNLKAVFYDELKLEVAKVLQVPATKFIDEVERLFAPGNIMSRIKYLGTRLCEKGLVWVVAIDEFTDVFKTKKTSEQVPDFVGMLRSLLDNKTFHLFLVGMDSLIELKKLYFPNDSEIIEDCPLTYLEQDDLECLLRLPMEGALGEKCFAGGTTVFCELMEWSGGVPQLAQLLCSKLVELLNREKRRRVMDGDIEKVGKSLCSQRKIDTFTTFTEMGLPGFDDYMLTSLYKEIAESTPTGSVFVPLRSLNIELGILNLLLDRKVIVEEAGSIRFKSRLFAEWVKGGGLDVRQVIKKESPLDGEEVVHVGE